MPLPRPISFTDGGMQSAAFAAATTAVLGLVSNVVESAPALRQHLPVLPPIQGRSANNSALQEWSNQNVRANEQVRPFDNGQYCVNGLFYIADVAKLSAAAPKMSYTGLDDLAGLIKKSLRPFHLPTEVDGVLVPPLRFWPKRLHAVWPRFRKQATFDALSNIIAALFVVSGKAAHTWQSLSQADIAAVTAEMKRVFFKKF